MEALRLTKEVVVRGRDLFGRPAYIKFIPTHFAGWMFKENGKSGVILPENVRYGWNHLMLANGRGLHILEHILVLKWFGLTSVCVESSPWPPYFGRAYEFWMAIKEFCVPSGDKIQWCTAGKNSSVYYPKKRAGRDACTEIRDNDAERLEIKVIVDYPGLGDYELNLSLPAKNLLEDLLMVHNQGWPSHRYYASKLMSFLRLWPHHKTAIWPQELLDKRLALSWFAAHRAADILGALALLGGDNLLAARVVSLCSGYWADLGVVNKIKDKLCYL
jgi:hypothetical protein